MAQKRIKTNTAKAVSELIQIAEKKSVSEDYKEKHGNKAQYGWYRYDTQLDLPVYHDVREVQRYNIYKLRMLVRNDEDGKLLNLILNFILATEHKINTIQP